MKFVDDSVVERLHSGSRRNEQLVAFIEELYKHPNRWAEYPEGVVSPSGMYRQARKYADIDIRIAGGNLLPKHHPDKKLWTAYLRFVPKTGPKKKNQKLLKDQEPTKNFP